MGKIFSPGKLLLTSEYVVLDGALALAIPTKYGQEFFFEEKHSGKSEIIWEANHEGQLWLSAKINYKNWVILESNISVAAEFILSVLKNIQKLSKTKFQDSGIEYHLKTNLQFPADYGLGSSSTLMNNLAEWSGIDAFVLNDISLGGSGYDIAVAKEKSAILYQINNNDRIVEKINFSPSFYRDLIFIHLNRKQNSREGINYYKSKDKSRQMINEFSEITKNILKCDSLHGFSELMTSHEHIMSDFLQIENVKNKYFRNCPVFVKSLGAWGGDFVMSCKFQGFKQYFSELGFSTVLNYENLIY